MASTIYRLNSLVIFTIALIGFVPISTALATEKGCPDYGWTFYEKDKLCIKAFGKDNVKDHLNWYEAKENCIAYNGGGLVQIYDEDTNNFVAKLFDKAHYKYTWIGIKNNAGRAIDFKYADGSDIGKYQTWNEQRNFSLCVAMWLSKKYPMEWFEHYCIYDMPYVCYTLPIPTKPVTTPGCPDGGWALYKKEKSCLKTFGSQYDDNKYLSWYKARTACGEYGGDLVQIHDEEKSNFVANLLDPVRHVHAWIGVKNRLKGAIDFKYVNGSDLGHYHPWADDYPRSDYHDLDLCVVMQINADSTVEWFEHHCTYGMAYVCSTGCPDEDWTFYKEDKTCVKAFATGYSTEPLNWTNAREACHTFYGGDLVQIHDGHKNEFVYNLLQYSRHVGAWIGVKNHNNSTGYDYKYVNGSVLGHYFPKDNNLPYGSNTTRYKCMAMWNKREYPGEWYPWNCTDRKPYVCSTAAMSIKPAITTPIPTTTPTRSTSKPTGCPDGGWTFYQKDNTCLKAFGKGDKSKWLSWSEANESCHALRASLVQIHDHSQKEIVCDMFDGARYNWTWTGIKNRVKGGFYFKYVNGSHLGHYHPWGKGYPKGDNDKDRKCVAMWIKGPRLGYWFDWYCNISRGPYVCSIHSSLSVL